MNRPSPRELALLGVIVATFVVLAWTGARRNAPTWDEPAGIATGLAMWRHGDFRLDPEHPPLARLWATLPLTFDDSVRFDASGPAFDDAHTWEVAWNTLYVHNHPDSLVFPARAMVLGLGVALLLIVFFWARALFGSGPALVATALGALEPNLLAHSVNATTDLPATFCFVATSYALWRLTRRLTPWNALATAFGVAAAIFTKFSMLVLGPALVVVLVLKVFGPGAWDSFRGALESRKARLVAASGVVVVTAFACVSLAWGAYGGRWKASAPQLTERILNVSAEKRSKVPGLSAIATVVSEYRLLPNALVEGFLLGRAKAVTRNSYLFGEISETGFAWYFPVAIAVKTPLLLLALVLVGLFSLRSAKEPWVAAALVPPGLMLLGALVTNLNIGLRHVLPLWPAFLLLAAAAVARLSTLVRPLAVHAVVPLVAALELVPAAPHWLAFFNVAAGGPGNGHRILVDSNLDWGQDLRGLGEWMRENRPGVPLNLSYFGLADPAAYGMEHRWMPPAMPGQSRSVDLPKLPGVVAVSATYLHGVYMDPAVNQLYAPLLERTPAAVIGFTIFVYDVDRVWWTAPR